MSKSKKIEKISKKSETELKVNRIMYYIVVKAQEKAKKTNYERIRCL